MNPPRPLLSREFVLGYRRSRILDAVAELSAEHGYEAMTITDIVSRAGVARKTLYENYGGKEEVFLAAVDAAFAAALERTEAACAAGGGEWRERVSAGLAGLLDHLADHPAEARMLIVEAPAATTASAGRYQAAIVRFTALLADATPAAEGPSGTIEEAVVGGVAWILNCQIRRGEAERIDDLAAELSEFVLAPWAGPVR
jgi:AcrR family transcriptional regulator